MAQLVPLIPHLVQVLVRLLLQAVQEALLLKLVHALLKQLSRHLVAILTQAELGLNFNDQLSIGQDFLCAQGLLWRSLIIVWCGSLVRRICSVLLLLRRQLGGVPEEQLVVVVQDVVIDLLLDSLDRMVDQALNLLSAGRKALPLTCKDVVRLLKIVCCVAAVLLLSFVLQETALEGTRRVKVDALGHEPLLVLEHLFARVPDQPQLVHIDLNLVLVVLKAAQDCQGVTNAHIVSR